MTEREKQDWALNDRAAKVLIGTLLTIQVGLLLAVIVSV